MVHHRTAEVRAAGIQQQAGAADLQGDALGVEGQLAAPTLTSTCSREPLKVVGPLTQLKVWLASS